MSFRPESVVKKVQRRVRNTVTPTGANYKKGSSQKLRDKAAQVVKKKRAKGLVGKAGKRHYSHEMGAAKKRVQQREIINKLLSVPLTN